MAPRGKGSVEADLRAAGLWAHQSLAYVGVGADENHYLPEQRSEEKKRCSNILGLNRLNGKSYLSEHNRQSYVLCISVLPLQSILSSPA